MGGVACAKHALLGHHARSKGLEGWRTGWVITHYCCLLLGKHLEQVAAFLGQVWWKAVASGLPIAQFRLY